MASKPFLKIGREFIHGDFSRIRDAPWREIAERVASESTEALYCAAAMYPTTRIAGAAIRAGAAAFAGAETGVACRGLAARAISWMRGVFSSTATVEGVAEGRLAIAEARAAAAAKETVVGVGGLAEEAATSRWVNLVSEERTGHILEGKVYYRNGKEIYSGGHRYPGLPGKTIFPREWGRDKIMHHVSDVATDPKVPWIPSKQTSRVLAIGEREGVRIRTVIETKPEQRIITAYPE